LFIEGLHFRKEDTGTQQGGKQEEAVRSPAASTSSGGFLRLHQQ